MNLLIDGHNLIGAGIFDDIHLSDGDDEAKLVARLRVWKSRFKGKMTVIFDRGIPGGRDRVLGGAGVEVIFAADPAEADDLIRRRIQRIGQRFVLVTHDAALVREAKAHDIVTWTGAELIRRLALSASPAPEGGTESDVQLSRDEVAEWMQLFDKRKTRPGGRLKTDGSSKKAT